MISIRQQQQIRHSSNYSLLRLCFIPYFLSLHHHAYAYHQVKGLPVEPVPLKKNGPFCFRVSSITDLKPQQNFLATQVWPASRVAAHMIHRHFCQPQQQPQQSSSSSSSKPLTLCELGCGPGAPSIMAAHIGLNVIATDLDELALHLVQAAADEQGLAANLKTQKVDLLGDYLPQADIYVLSDVFESATVAEGAARLLWTTMTEHDATRSLTKRVWVFCQSDRAQRETFLETLRSSSQYPDAKWISTEDYDPTKLFTLFNVEETEVQYY